MDIVSRLDRRSRRPDELSRRVDSEPAQRGDLLHHARPSYRFDLSALRANWAHTELGLATSEPGAHRGWLALHIPRRSEDSRPGSADDLLLTREGIAHVWPEHITSTNRAAFSALEHAHLPWRPAAHPQTNRPDDGLAQPQHGRIRRRPRTEFLSPGGAARRNCSPRNDPQFDGRVQLDPSITLAGGG